MLNYKFVYQNNYEDCEFKLSPFSREFCERHITGSEWYELTPVFDYEKMAKKTNDGIEFTFDYYKLKKEWEELLEKAKKELKTFYKKVQVQVRKYVWREEEIPFEGYKGKPVKVAEFPTEVNLKVRIFNYFIENEKDEKVKEKLEEQKLDFLIECGDVIGLRRGE